MRREKFVQTIILCSICAFATTAPAMADTVIDFTYESTQDPFYNHAVHMRNTGVQVSAGDIVNVTGQYQIYFGGGYHVSTNFDMGIISPSSSLELKRNYIRENGFSGEPVPLAQESLLFAQERYSNEEQHDLLATFTAQSDGYLFVGVWDQYFQDNSGSHFFQFSIVPEPSSVTLIALPVLSVLFRRRRP